MVAPPNSAWAVIPRVFWLMVGPILLATLAAVVLARCFEFWAGRSLTAEGKPAIPSDLDRFALLVVTAGMASWAVANGIGNHPSVR